ncbi:acyl-CoA dehydrogenase [Pueribacillus theae]|uniref:Acyl-CoA dehydrogenase n=1 Tax=Pueribacillus theae TaxID=2171751 RepID=A0A2U1K346_9BACI|nr:acyl-CoA dehydrogenase family protein [Pueribacillus theae]PWA11957.1 acyl-CoA dehydrogenase [Pueribacillus theae]
MDFSLTDEQKMVQKTVREFVEKELVPLEQDVLRNEREGRPGISKEKIRELQAKAKGMGFWGILTPEEYGGANLGPIMSALIEMELSRTFVDFKFGGHAMNILYTLNEEQKKKYLLPVLEGERKECFALTEPGSGSDPRNMTTTAVKDGNEWVINGEKTFISYGNEADFAILFAKTGQEKSKDAEITCFLVDREMGWKSENIETMGGWNPASLIFDNVRVPEENIVGEIGEGIKYAMYFINHNRGWVIPPRCVGASERLLQMGIEFAKTRVTFGKPIVDRQAIQWMIADSAIEIEAAKGIFLRAAWMAEKDGIWANSQDSIQFRHQAAISKFYGTNMVNRVVDRVLQIYGGMGVTKETPVERWYRVVRVWRIFEGSDEMQRRTIADNLIKEKVKIGELL